MQDGHVREAGSDHTCSLKRDFTPNRVSETNDKATSRPSLSASTPLGHDLPAPGRNGSEQSKRCPHFVRRDYGCEGQLCWARNPRTASTVDRLVEGSPFFMLPTATTATDLPAALSVTSPPGSSTCTAARAFSSCPFARGPEWILDRAAGTACRTVTDSDPGTSALRHIPGMPSAAATAAANTANWPAHGWWR